MNNNQINDINQKIDTFNLIKVDDILSNIFINQDIQNIKIGQYTVPEYSSVLSRIFKQLSIEISENGEYLPFQYNFQNDFGNGTLNNDIQNIINSINANNHNNLNSSIAFINRLVYYQIANGFWDKSTRKIHKYNEIKVTELNQQLKLIEKQLISNAENLKTNISDLKKEKENLIEFINQKNQELQQVKSNLISSNTNTNQISQLLNNSTSTFEKINSLLVQQTQSFDNNKKKIETESSAFSEHKKNLKIQENENSENISILNNQIENFNEKLEFVENKKEYFEERNNYLNELIGREVGVSLFETFRQRKGELEKPVAKWLYIVIIMSVFTFLAILVIFTKGFGYLGDNTIEMTTTGLITNSIKTLPFFFLLFYAISQYNKERNFQEEYAFKSAVALTIKAYSDIIQKDELKDELIMSSVSGIYKSPTIYNSKKTKEDNTMLTTAKDLLTTAMDIMKKK
jgi:hypothetical protein